MRILGHRGASRDFPENTLPAFTGAVAQGADGVELDVMRCATGELVVCHDEVLDRVAGLRLEIPRTSWAELAQVDVGSTLGFAPAHIPLLDEVLDAVPRGLLVNVELKCDREDDGGLSVATARRLVERHEGDRVLVSSFNPKNLLRVAEAAPGLRRGLLLDPQLPLEPQLQWLSRAANSAVHPHHSHCTAERVDAWQHQHLEVVVWTVDDAAHAAHLQHLEVDAIITNVPARLREALAGRAPTT